MSDLDRLVEGNFGHPRCRWLVGVGTWRSARVSRIAILAAASLILPMLFASCSSRPTAPDPVLSRQRAEDFPSELPGLRAAAQLHWNAQLVPFFEAEDEEDVPYLLGALQAHLRLGQMEVMRRLSQGRLSEMAGPFATDLDWTIRTLDLGRANPEILRLLPGETRRWLERYVEGINDFRRLNRVRPPEFRWLGLPEEEWRLEDVITLGRLAGADLNWLLYYNFLKNGDVAGWESFFDRLKASGAAATTSFGGPEPLSLLADNSKSGSNSFVVGGARTRHGAALMASDPHVGFTLPTLWMVVGYHSPRSHVLGFMLPGIPFVLLGRNPDIAWGGTNMNALNSALYDLSKVPSDAFRERKISIRRRWFGTVQRSVRDTEWGPVITDAPLFAKAFVKPVALKWRGHQASDEWTAFLKVSRASNWEEFRQAFATYAVSGQNMLYADRFGNIGQLPALEYVPAAGRIAQRPLGDPGLADHRWDSALSSIELPCAYNPAAGFLVSTNNNPVRTAPPLTLTAAWNDRQNRLTELLTQAESIDATEAARLQTDVFSESSLRAARAFVGRIHLLNTPLDRRGQSLLDRLGQWDGNYSVDSLGAPACQAILCQAARLFYAKTYGSALSLSLMNLAPYPQFFAEDVEAGRMDDLLPLLASEAARDVGSETRWGDWHKLRLNHWLGMVPYLGRPFRFGEILVPGSLTTVWKTAGSLEPAPHFVRYGANARQISDLRDLDSNFFVLMGGQDGWMSSPHFLDQVESWLKGQLYTIPMRPSTFASSAIHSQILRTK